ncbi:MAG: PilZ domain-containing protein [Gammaproteobacteria bacterium]|nr:MAG: PilZ domain-containing protein [Gammaproteobacteria bacterium]
MSSQRTEARSKKLRKFVRVKPEDGAPIKVELQGEGLIEAFFVNDISQSGVSLDLTHPIEQSFKELKVTLSIALPNPINGSVIANGIIKHIDAKMLGIMFSEIEEDAQDKIREYVHFRLRPTTSGLFGRILDWFDVPT